MPDREKVIKGLEWILEDDRFGFGQGLTKPETDEEQAGCFIRNALTLLKEQEAVEPEWSRGTPFCGNCGHRLEKKSRNTSGIKCPTCGRLVKWE